MKCSALVSVVLSLAVAPSLAVAESAVSSIGEAISQVDSMTFADLMTKTAGDVRPGKFAKYAGNFSEYWNAAASSLEGKTLEAVVTQATNARLRAVGGNTRLVPTALLGQAADAADILVVNSAGTTISRAQAKLSADLVIDALGDPKYTSMDILTTQDSYDELSRRLQKEAAKAARRGQDLKPAYHRLRDAMESGRLWKKLPCGAPLPERAYVNKVAFEHYAARWREIARAYLGTQDDAVRGGISGARHASKAIENAAETADDAARASAVADDCLHTAASAADDAGKGIGNTLIRCAGPVAVAVEFGVGGYEAYGTERKFAVGEITHEEREVAHARVVGGIGGSWVGGSSGAAGGAAIGTMILPGAGTVVGGVVGGIGGALGGSAAGRYVAAEAIEVLHDSGTTIASATCWLGARACDGYEWLTDW